MIKLDADGKARVVRGVDARKQAGRGELALGCEIDRDRLRRAG